MKISWEENLRESTIEIVILERENMLDNKPVFLPLNNVSLENFPRLNNFFKKGTPFMGILTGILDNGGTWQLLSFHF